MQGPVIFVSVIVIGLLLMVFVRRDSVDQLSRLAKHSRRMAEKMHDRADPESIFVAQKTDYLSRLLAQAGKEAEYDKMKTYWICSAIGAGLIFALLFVLQGLVEMAPVGFFVGLPVGAAGFVYYLGEVAKTDRPRSPSNCPRFWKQWCQL